MQGAWDNGVLAFLSFPRQHSAQQYTALQVLMIPMDFRAMHSR
jgi:hypothetical protein